MALGIQMNLQRFILWNVQSFGSVTGGATLKNTFACDSEKRRAEYKIHQHTSEREIKSILTGSMCKTSVK